MQCAVRFVLIVMSLAACGQHRESGSPAAGGEEVAVVTDSVLTLRDSLVLALPESAVVGRPALLRLRVLAVENPLGTGFRLQAAFVVPSRGLPSGYRRIEIGTISPFPSDQGGEFVLRAREAWAEVPLERETAAPQLLLSLAGAESGTPPRGLIVRLAPPTWVPPP